jgi:hypothetical protein
MIDLISLLPSAVVLVKLPFKSFVPESALDTLFEVLNIGPF